MIKQQSPTVTQANFLFFMTAVITLAGSVFFQPKLGIGTNLWINEFVYILFPPLLLARLNGWSVEDVYRFRKTTTRNKVISIFSGLSMWLFAFYISKITRVLLDQIGVLPNPRQASLSIYQSLLLIIGMVVLAPICEEIFFRGLVQRAYEGSSQRFGFVMAALLFGSYHVLNGISEVIPASILGLGMGYLVYKTDSIATSMLFHAAANICAVLLGGAIDTATHGVIPAWLHIIAFAGLGLSVVLLRSLKDQTQSRGTYNEVYMDKKASTAGVFFFVLAAMYLTAVGIMESWPGWESFHEWMGRTAWIYAA